MREPDTPVPAGFGLFAATYVVINSVFGLLLLVGLGVRCARTGAAAG